MCGIVGYLGHTPAKPILLDLLARLEYRGYDSCGIAIQGQPLMVFKDTRRVQELAGAVPQEVPGTVGIGHTRWATHGRVTPDNAHPHLDCLRRIAVVHNGIIDNFQELRTELRGEGHIFSSETDTEVIAHLIEKYYQGVLEDAARQTTARLRGSWALAALAADEYKLVAARQQAPMVIGIGDNAYVLASDTPAVLGHASSVIYLEDGDVAVMDKNGLVITRDGQEIERPPQRVAWSTEDTAKNGHEHFTLKEILEQPVVIRRSLADFPAGQETPEGFCLLAPGEPGGMTIIACGSSYHAGLVGKQIIENLLEIPVSVINASEYPYQPARTASLAIAITQSGETADVLAAARHVKNAGIPILAITNAPHSSITGVSDRVIYTNAGPEVGVAATKTFTAQLVALIKLVLSSPRLGPQERMSLTEGLMQLPEMVERVCTQGLSIEASARFMAGCVRTFIIGRGVNLPIAYEGALKMKELAYIHAEGYSAGELKHGPFALLDQHTPVIAVMADDETHRAMIRNIHEVRARNSPVVALTYDGDETLDEPGCLVVRLPRASYPLSTVVNSVALQLLAYYAAKLRGCPIDFPRNIAKSVTVE